MAKIAVGGFQHETNTFAPSKATYEDFLTPSAWPGLTRGRALFEAVAGINIPIAGFIARAREAGHDLRPLAWSAATPSAHVTRDAYERIAGQLLEDLAGLRDLAHPTSGALPGRRSNPGRMEQSSAGAASRNSRRRRQ